MELIDVEKVYPNGVQAVYNFNLEIKQNDFVALVGPSGCGKSTTLRMIAGLEEVSAGALYIKRKFSNYTPSKDRNIAMVFQSYALYPQLTVFDNIAFGLRILKVPKKEIEDRVFAAASILDLGKYLDRRPKELSGGQMQRVALGRAIVRKADIFLMDEPLSNLDAKLRLQMRAEIVRIHKEAHATTVYVTHDQTEAMTMANKIVVMNKGFIQQIDAPMTIYNHPSNLFVANFIGAPAMNVIDTTYFNGQLKFKDQCTIQLSDEVNAQIRAFFIHQIDELKQVMQDEKSIATFLSQLDSRLIKENENQINKAPKKEDFIHRIINKFKKTEISNYDFDRGDIKEKLQDLLATYQNALKHPYALKFGIRPEDIKLVDNDEKPAFTIKTKTTFVEPLGSEYIVHTEWNESDLIIKLDVTSVVDNDQEVVLKLNLDKIHLFDPNDGKAIF
ncbi:MAG TPA: ATP-binding cassette domain-containing protein [Bacilli bacterium]|nr:ATP-binding cassette domain-containing protein [Bacilli bacterium]